MKTSWQRARPDPKRLRETLQKLHEGLVPLRKALEAHVEELQKLSSEQKKTE